MAKPSEDTDSPVEKRYVLILYTGGTIGMVEGSSGYAPKPGELEKLMATFPNLNDPNYKATDEDKMKMPMQDGKPVMPLALAETQDHFRVVYGILQFNPLLDSSNMNMHGWVKMAEHVKMYYQQFDGFVILHGTDTMAYTASALSFMLEYLGKGVVITGSQVPLFRLRTDALSNLVGSLIMAGRYSYTIKEVTLFFDDKLFRGNRVTKVNASKFDAFASPNLPPLATIGVDVEIKTRLLFDISSLGALTVHEDMSPDVGVIMLFPGITAETMTSFLNPLKGAVLLTFGAGNGPTNKEFLQALAEADKRGVLMLNITQCLKGRVEDDYATGTALKENGVVPGADMTPEAGLTKVSYLVGWMYSQFKERPVPLKLLKPRQEEAKLGLSKNLRGELTVDPGPTPFL